MKKKQYPQESKIESKNSFKIMTWNVLSDTFANTNKFSYVQHPLYLSYQYRIKLIQKIIQQKDCDILCLQQVDQRESFFQFLTKNGYEYVVRNKNNHAIVTAYKTKKIKLIKSHIVNFDENVNKDMNKEIYCQGNGAIILTLEIKQRTLILVNTQIYWNPHFQRVKYHQICTIIKKLVEMGIDQKNQAIVLVGDFNSLPYSNAMRLLLLKSAPSIQRCTQGNKNYYEMIKSYNSIKQQLLDLKTCFKQENKIYTTYTQDFKGEIDYILYTDNFLGVINSQQLIEEKQLSIETALPNSSFPSDHLQLICELGWK